MGQAYTFLLKAVALCAAAFFVHDKRQPLKRLPFVVDATGEFKFTSCFTFLQK